MASSSSAAYPALFFTQNRTGDDKLWVVYWLTEESKFGIASLPDAVYEMDAEGEMRDILGTMFEEGQTEIEQVNDESATVCYAFKHSLELPRVEDAAAQRQRIDRLVKFLVGEAREKKRMEQLAVADDNEAQQLQMQMRIRQLEKSKRRGLASVFARFVRHFIQRWGHRHRQRQFVRRQQCFFLWTDRHFIGPSAEDGPRDDRRQSIREIGTLHHLGDATRPVDVSVSAGRQSMAPGDDGKIYDAPMVGVSVGLSRSGTSGGLIYFEVAETDPFNANSHKNSLVITAGGGMLDTLATDSIIIARCAAKKIMREQQNSYLDRANLHLNIVSTGKPGSIMAGPSGGLAEGIAFVSMATKKKPRANIAMTGHLTLNGAVLPIGSIKEKVIAAKEAKMTSLMVPIGNKKEYDDLRLGEVAKNEMHVQFVAKFADAIKYCFG